MKALIILLLLLFSCRTLQEPCWSRDRLQLEWYRLVDWRELMLYMSCESPDSTTRVEAAKVAERLHARIMEVEYLMHTEP